MVTVEGEAEPAEPGKIEAQGVSGNGPPPGAAAEAPQAEPAQTAEPAPAPEPAVNGHGAGAAVAAEPGHDEPRPAAQPAPQPAGTVLGTVAAVPIDPREVGASVGVLLLWLVLLAAGITVPTQPYIEAVRNRLNLSLLEALGSLVVITFCHTATNNALLCCLAAFLGVIGSRSINAVRQVQDPHQGRLSAYVAAATRGFFVFLIMQSGAVAFADEPFQAAGPEKYIRLAAMASLVSFAVGYNPRLFQNLLTRVDSLTSGAGRSGARPPAAGR
jgi:hypothetical protein